MKVLVTDSDSRTALYVIRSLGGRKINVTAQVEKKYYNSKAFGCKSKYLKDKVVTSTGPEDEERFIHDLSKVARNCDAIIPIKTKTIMSIACHREKFKNIGCLIPDYEQLKLVQNKSDICRYSTKIGILTPKTYFPVSIEEAKAMSRAVKYPVYIKLREEGDFSPSERYAVAFNRSELISLYITLHQRFQLPIIQEKITGTGMGYFALFDQNSKLVAYFGHRRIRQYPFRGGPSSCCESCKNKQIIFQGNKLLASLKWKGLAMVEFIMDDKDGLPKLLEVNPRFWGSTPLAIAAGVDFPHLLLQVSLGEGIKESIDYLEGVKIRFIVNDLIACVDYMKNGKNNAEFLYEFIRDIVDLRIKDGVIRFDDIAPAFAYLARLITGKGQT